MISTPYRHAERAFYEDVPVVSVEGGDLEKALKALRKRLSAAGTFRLLKERRRNPSGADRKRLKRKKNRARNRKR